MVKIFKQQNNGEVGVLSDSIGAEDFLDEFTEAVAQYAEENPDDLSHDFSSLLRNGYKISLKLAGYKSPDVTTRQVQWCGDHLPGDTEICEVCFPSNDDSDERRKRRQVEAVANG